MRVKVEGKWYQVERFLTNGIETTNGELLADEKLEAIITEAEWKKGRRYVNEN